MKSYFYIFILFPFFIFQTVYSEQSINQCKFKWLTIDNGLSNNRTICLTKDSVGYIWIGTDDGVCKFDGINVKVYTPQTENEYDQWNMQITSLLTDNVGNLWKGSLNLYKYNREKDCFELVSPKNTEVGPERIRDIKQLNDSSLLLGSRNGLFVYNIASKTFTRLPANSRGEYYEVWNTLIQENKIWVGTRNNGIVLYDMLKFEYKEIAFYNENNIRANTILCSYLDHEKTLWVGTKYNGIFKINTLTNEVTEHEYPDKNCKRIRKIVHDKNGNLWIGTMDGLYTINAGSKEYYRYAHIYNETSTLSHNSVFNIYIDNHQNMWLNTYAGGVNYTNLEKKPISVLTNKDNNALYLNDGIVAGSTEDNNNLYIGTDHGGLNIMDKKTGNLTYISHEKGKLSGTNIKCLTRDKFGNVLIGTYAGGLNIYNTKTKNITIIKSTSKRPDVLSSNTIYSIAQDKLTGDIWLGTDAGIDFIDIKSKEVKRITNNNIINQLYCDNNNNIWCGSGGDGIYKWDRKRQIFIPFCEDYNIKSINSIYRDTQNNLWISGKEGVSIISLPDKKLHQYSKNNQLPTNIILGILEDNNQNIWLSTSFGISKLINAVNHPDSFKVRTYTINDGLLSNQFWRNSFYKGMSGIFYFGSVSGLVYFNPDSLKDNPYIPRVNITGMRIFNKEVGIGEEVMGDTILKKSMETTKEINLSYRHNVFSIEFNVLHYNNSMENTIAYKLLPLENEWNYIKPPINSATYTSLPGGKYTFMVKGANSDGKWCEIPDTLIINISPPIWKTWWFKSIIIITIISSALLIYFNHSKNITKRNILLEKTVKQRTYEISRINRQLFEQKDKLEELNTMKDKFLSIIAHDLKNPFQTIMGFSDILDRKFENINESKKRQYISIMNESSHRLYNLLENMLTWARSQTNGIEFIPGNTEIKEIIKHNIILLHGKTKKHNLIIENKITDDLFVYADQNMVQCMFRNLLSNAVKFSKDNSTIVINHEIKNKKAVISIKDEGIGMSSEIIEKIFIPENKVSMPGTHGEKGTGLGLIITKEFVERNNGEIWVESEPDKGSTFSFTLPLFDVKK